MSNAFTPAAVVSSEFTVGAFTLTIAANTSNYNVYNQFVSAYGVPPSDVALVVRVNAGVVVSSLSSSAALTWGNSWTGTPTFSLVNLGYIVGRGGAGGAAGKAINLTGGAANFVSGSGSPNVLGAVS